MARAEAENESKSKFMAIEHIIEGMEIFDGVATSIEYFEKKYGPKEILNPILNKIPLSNLIYYQENTFVFEDIVIRFIKNPDIYKILKDNPHPNLETITDIYEYKKEIIDRETSRKIEQTNYIVVSNKYSKFDKKDFDIMDKDKKEKFKNDICNAIIHLYTISGSFHNDISFDNIVYDEKTDNYVLIDYGMMKSDHYRITANKGEFTEIGLEDCVIEHFSSKYLKYKKKYLHLRNKL